MNSKYYIFLDIDGVLATSRQYYTNPKKWNDVYHRYRFDEKCVKVFNTIIEKINPVIILSSDWKLNYTIEVLNRIFEINGVNTIITDITPNLWGSKFISLAQLQDCRADEILLYVHEHQIKKYLAIDDLDLSPWIDAQHFIRTPRASEGIKQSGIKEKILSVLLN
jgi:hypothetical protein